MSKAKDATVRDAEVVEPGTSLARGASAVMAGHDQELDRLREMMQTSLTSGVSVDAIERITRLYREEQDRRAGRALILSLAAFQQDVPPIPKKREAVDAERAGNKVLYRFAALDDIARTIAPTLLKHGLSYAWDVEESPMGVKVSCIISHEQGASRASHFSCPTTAGTKIMSAPQRTASAVTYAKRQSLIQALGLVTTDEDLDARDESLRAGLSDEQAARIEELLSEPLTDSDRVKFLAVYGAASVEDLPASCFDAAVRMLTAKRKGTAR